MAMACVSLKGNECVQHGDIMPASDLLARIKQLNSVDDELRLQRGGPMVQTAAELAVFIDVYNELVNGYILLEKAFSTLSEEQKSV